jgi:hypothetical protein
MKYVGNFSDWITPELIAHLDKTDIGQTHIWDEDRWTGHPILEKYKNLARPGYSTRTDWFQQFFKMSSVWNEFPVNVPIDQLPEKRNQCFWWIIKLQPGQFQPVHVDPHLTGAVRPKRYAMFLQDWEPGHIFLYDDQIITNYKAGDTYDWEDEFIEHAAGNIGFNNRYTLQIAMHDEIIGDFLCKNEKAAVE